MTIGSALGFACLYESGPPPLRLPGVVETQDVRLGSKVGGRVRHVAVKEGEVVRAGQELVTLEAPELEARRDQLTAALEAAQAQLARAQNGARAAEKAAAKATVALADARLRRLRAGPRPEEITAALGEWKGLQFELERARREWDREVRMQASRATSAAQVDVTWAATHRLQEQARAAQARWQLLANGTRAEEIDEAEADLRRAQAQFDLVDQGTRPEEIAEAKARVAELYAKVREVEVLLREAVVTAPDAALVETIAVRRGDVAEPNQPLVRVLLAEDLWVKAYVPEPQLGRVGRGQAVTVTVDAFPGRPFRGRVAHVASTSEFTPRNVATADERRHQVFAIKVRVLESEAVFKSGMAADVLIPLAAEPEDVR